MKSRIVWALVALNVVLLAALVGRWMKPDTAIAAQAAAAARPGDYIMVPAEVVGGNGAVVYIVDTTNNQLSAMALDQNNLVTMQPIDLTRVFEARGGAARPRGGRN
jgi:hypothetical protein